MRILLVDLNSVLHPIWHVSSKEPDPDYAAQTTVARIHGMAHEFDAVAICCDSPKSARKELDPSYKANRPERDERLIHQIKLAQGQLKADGYPVWQVDGWEADDVIASAVALGRQTLAASDEITICSSDKDLLQLLGVNTLVYTPNGKLFTPKDCAEKFVPPEQMRDYLILVGDSSDNVKGVPGIGPVKAKALLAECGSIVGIYERIRAGKVLGHPFTPSIVTAMQESLMLVEATRKLIELRRDLPIPFDEILKPRAAAPMEDQMDHDLQTGEVIDQPEPTIEHVRATVPRDNTVLLMEAQAADKWTPTPPVRALTAASWNSELEPRSLGDAVKLAKFLFDSRMFSAYGTPQAVLSTILAGREFGIGAMASLRGIHNVEGKHALSAGLMAGLILRSGKAKQFSCIKRTNESATVRAWRLGEDEPLDITYTLEDAKRAKLVKPNGNWEKNPADMCVARATSTAARLKFADILFAMYSPGELGRDDLEDTEAA